MRRSILNRAFACSMLLLGAAALSPQPAMAQTDARTADLVGTWSNPQAGVWEFDADGSGSITQSSNNGNPGQIRTEFSWSLEPGNTLVYTPQRTRLSNSVDSDRTETINPQRTYKQGFSLSGGAFKFGNYSYSRR